ncbi:MAG: hypothetical protein LBJ24_06035, partial [Treponema sp.]|nr:hypothetical protein [Treponema sp.]
KSRVEYQSNYSGKGKIFVSGLPPLRGLPKATGYAGGLLLILKSARLLTNQPKTRPVCLLSRLTKTCSKVIFK